MVALGRGWLVRRTLAAATIARRKEDGSGPERIGWSVVGRTLPCSCRRRLSVPLVFVTMKSMGGVVREGFANGPFLAGFANRRSFGRPGRAPGMSCWPEMAPLHAGR